MNVVVFTEEPSMKAVLDIILPKILPSDATPLVVPFQGRGDLESRAGSMLCSWNTPDTRFVIVEDQDNEDCIKRKQRLQSLIEKSGKDVLVRIVCRELEAWYFGDLKAVEQAYDCPGIAKKYANKKKYRKPDEIIDVKEQFKSIFPEHQQIGGAKKIAPFMDIGNNNSPSFRAFISGIYRFVNEGKD